MASYKNILISGGTGFIGSALVEELLKQGHFIRVITRNTDKYSDSAKNLTYIGWDDDLAKQATWADVVVNLAGESIFGKRWTEEVKKRLRQSRIEVTRNLVDAMRNAQTAPDVFISASAIGYYGDTGDKPVDEKDEPGNDFLAQVCVDWEKEAQKSESIGIRTVIPRLGIVLEKGGGALETMLPAFKLFVGGPVGSGEQYVPWIHLTDVIQALTASITTEKMGGIYNFCAPNPVTMNTFADAVATALNRPSLFKVPSFVLKTALGEAATPILASIRAEPQRLLDAGYKFDFDDIYLAMADIT